MTKPLPCPWCGEDPNVYPLDSEMPGNAWVRVQCDNPDCAAQPRVPDGETVSDDRGLDAYKECAIIRWNTRQYSKPFVMACLNDPTVKAMYVAAAPLEQIVSTLVDEKIALMKKIELLYRIKP